MKSQRFILIAMMVTMGSSGIAYYLPESYRKRTLWGKNPGGGDFPPMKFFLGAGVVFFGISAIGEFKPSFAGPFSGLVATTALLFNGIPAVEYVVKSKPQKVVNQPVNAESGDLTSNLQTMPDPKVIHFPANHFPTVKPKKKVHVVVVPGTNGQKVRLPANTP